MRDPRGAEFIWQEESSEQAREEARRAGRATATRSAMAAEAGWWPAWPAVACQAGRSARAQADHVADAARTEPLNATTFDKKRRPIASTGRCSISESPQPTLAQRRRELLVEGREPFRFILDLAASGLCQRLKRIELDPPSLIAPGFGNGTIDEEARHRVRRPGIEDERPISLRQNLGAPGVDEQRRIPGR